MRSHKREPERTTSEPPESRKDQTNENREENLDKTIADSFPASDPPSSLPDPDERDADEEEAA